MAGLGLAVGLGLAEGLGLAGGLGFTEEIGGPGCGGGGQSHGRLRLAGDVDGGLALGALALGGLAVSRSLSLCLFSFSFSFSFFFEFSSFLSLRNSKLVMCTSPKITNRIKSNLIN